MKKEIFKELKKFNLSPNQLQILIDLSNVPESFNSFNHNLLEIKNLIRRGLVESNEMGNFEDLKLTSISKKIIDSIFDEKPVKEITVNVTKDNIITMDNNIEWLEEWRNGFGELQQGAKGSKQGCIKNMQAFLKKHPTVTKEQIFLARDLYFSKIDNLKYLQQADYFIIKSGNSRLEQYIEMLDDNENNSVRKWDDII